MQTAISYSLTHCLISKLSGLAISWRNERSVGKIDYGLMHNLLTTNMQVCGRKYHSAVSCLSIQSPS